VGDLAQSQRSPREVVSFYLFLNVGNFLPLNQASPGSSSLILNSCFSGEFACYREEHVGSVTGCFY
jgi:hypothetical protein